MTVEPTKGIQSLLDAHYDHEADRWLPRCPHGDICTGCDASGYCDRGREDRSLVTTSYRRSELLVVPGEHDGSTETSIKVLERVIVEKVAHEAEIIMRFRVKAVGNERVILTIEREDETSVELLVRL